MPALESMTCVIKAIPKFRIFRIALCQKLSHHAAMLFTFFELIDKQPNITGARWVTPWENAPNIRCSLAWRLKGVLHFPSLCK